MVYPLFFRAFNRGESRQRGIMDTCWVGGMPWLFQFLSVSGLLERTGWPLAWGLLTAPRPQEPFVEAPAGGGWGSLPIPPLQRQSWAHCSPVAQPHGSTFSSISAWEVKRMGQCAKQDHFPLKKWSVSAAVRDSTAGLRERSLGVGPARPSQAIHSVCSLTNVTVPWTLKYVVQLLKFLLKILGST